MTTKTAFDFDWFYEKQSVVNFFSFNNPNAIFCLRNSSYVEDLPSDKIGRFVDQEQLNKLQLKVSVGSRDIHIFMKPLDIDMWGVVGSVPCMRNVAGSNPTLAAT